MSDHQIKRLESETASLRAQIAELQKRIAEIESTLGEVPSCEHQWQLVRAKELQCGECGEVKRMT